MASDYLKTITQELNVDSKDFNEISNKLKETIERVFQSTTPSQDTELVFPNQKIEAFEQLIQSLQESIFEDDPNYKKIQETLAGCESRIKEIKTAQVAKGQPRIKGAKSGIFSKPSERPETKNVETEKVSIKNEKVINKEEKVEVKGEKDVQEEDKNAKAEKARKKAKELSIKAEKARIKAEKLSQAEKIEEVKETPKIDNGIAKDFKDKVEEEHKENEVQSKAHANRPLSAPNNKNDEPDKKVNQNEKTSVKAEMARIKAEKMSSKDEKVEEIKENPVKDYKIAEDLHEEKDYRGIKENPKVSEISPQQHDDELNKKPIKAEKTSIKAEMARIKAEKMSSKVVKPEEIKENPVKDNKIAEDFHEKKEKIEEVYKETKKYPSVPEISPQQHDDEPNKKPIKPEKTSVKAEMARIKAEKLSSQHEKTEEVKEIPTKNQKVAEDLHEKLEKPKEEYKEIEEPPKISEINRPLSAPNKKPDEPVKNPSNLEKKSAKAEINRIKAEKLIPKPEEIQENPSNDHRISEDFHQKLEKVEKVYKEIGEKFNDLEVSLQVSPPNPKDDELVEINAEDSNHSIKQIENRLQEAETDKNKVQVLLDQVKSSIEGIQSLENYSDKNRKPNFECKVQTVSVYEEMKQKSELTNQRLKKFREDQKNREALLAKELKKINQKIEKEKNLLELENAKLQEAKNEEYKQELEKMKEKKQKRKQELEEIKKRQHDLDALKNSKPLYQKLEENFQQKLQKQEIITQKQKELRKKSPINVVDIMDHAKWYEDTKKEHQEKQKEKGLEKVRSASYGLASGWTAKVLEDDQRLKKELNRASQERLQMIERKARYAELVKEMFLPTVDRLKRQDNQSRSPRSEKFPDAKKTSPGRAQNSGFVSDGEAKMKTAKPKWKENPMVPKPVPKRQPAVVDYLEEKRRDRKDEVQQVDVDWEKELGEGHTNAEMIKMLKKKAKILEKKARREELLINGNATDAKTLKSNENVNDMLLGSIKAKLAALEQRGSK